ncbi:Probable Zinc-ribbon domain-containing protein [Halobacillus dabanensis]|uniref:Probable Zinc-ribbon domain-containing protein n=1 Tax=Halobacillus dabanensis TaxID=240302 RepID=A0A1I3RDG7_HALDA|nr:zinc-ribbon domain-containing protein [Halobacillus dabanensis]SFJ43401.1 Probable Zinc-ribbon domain-containing protein [Halobacillus dabanensis]
MNKKEYQEFLAQLKMRGYSLLSPEVKNRTEKVMLQCPKNHVFSMSSKDFLKGRGCSYCSGKRVLPEESFGVLYPSIMKTWDYMKNEGINPEELAPNSGKRLWWICEKGHHWEARVCNRTRGTGCPFCNGKKVVPKESLMGLFPDVALEWNYEKNGNDSPNMFTPRSNKEVWWICSNGHEWKMKIASRTNGAPCPTCKNENNLSENSLEITHPDIAKEWHSTKNVLSPSDVSYGSTKKVWWICKSGHEWKASCNNRSKGRGCPYCSNKKVTIESSIGSLRKELLKEWHHNKNGLLSPYEVSIGSGKKVWWVCNHGHEWKTAVNKRVAGQGCPKCKIYTQTSFAEQAIYFYVVQIFGSAKNRHKMNEGSNKCEVDVYIPELNVAIEYDGYTHKRMEQQIRDKNKNRILKKLCVPLFRIRTENLPFMEYYSACTINHSKELGLDQCITALFECFEEMFSLGEKHRKKIKELSINTQEAAVKIYSQYLKFKKTKNTDELTHLEKEWNGEKNEGLSLGQFSPYSNKKVWWICKYGHEWKTTLGHRSRGTNCPDCSGRRVSDLNSLEKNNPHLAREWNYQLNDKVPKEVAVNSNKYFWWVCSKGHEWEATVNNRNCLNRGCPYCSGRRKVVS